MTCQRGVGCLYLAEPMNTFPSIIGLLLVLSACTGGSAAARVDYENAVRYLQGVGVAQDEDKGIALLEKASKARNPEAELMLGFFKMKGEAGVETNPEAAMQLFLDAARQGNRDAQYNAALGYVRAQGVEQNYGEALKWFTAAALQGDPGAQFNLGVMHVSGEGTVVDPLTAYAWFSIAEQNGYAGSSEEREAARKAMNSDQAKEAEAKIESLLKKIVVPPAPRAIGIDANALQEAPL